MKTFTFIGSTKENHFSLICLGKKFGIQHIRKMTIGEAIAQFANDGNKMAFETCEAHPEFFISK